MKLYLVRALLCYIGDNVSFILAFLLLLDPFVFYHG